MIGIWIFWIIKPSTIKKFFSIILGTSSTASALSQYIDYLTDNAYSTALKNAVPMNLSGFGEFPDFMAFGFCIFVTRKIS